MVLIVLSCILVPLSVVAVWAHNQVLDTDEYVATVAPLARNEEIANALSVRVTHTLFDNLDVETTAKDVLREPPSSPGRSRLRSAIHARRTLQFFQSKQPGTLGRSEPQRHEQVVKALTGSGKVIKTKNGEVVLDLSALVVELRSQPGTGHRDLRQAADRQAVAAVRLFDAEG
jgi:hypothetical protein